MSNGLVVDANALTKHYGPVAAVDHVNMQVAHGDVYGFLGPNGAGKTTTLRMLVGLIRPSSGSAVVAGHPAGTSSSLARVGCLIESPAFYPYLSGVDNLRGIADYCQTRYSRVDEALEIVGLSSRARDKVKAYSQGMKQRLGVAAALQKEPDLLLLDEPTQGLDPQGVADMRDMIMSLARGGHTVLLSSHLLTEVEQMCTRVGVIQRGRMIAEGPVDDLRRAPGSVEVRANPVDRARDILRRHVEEESIVERDGLLEVRLDPSHAAKLNRSLVWSGVEVSYLAPVTRSLEHAFLELTEGESGL